MALVAAFAMLLSTAGSVLPGAVAAGRFLAARDDPARLTDLELEAIDRDGGALAARVATEIDAALAAEDGDLAASFVALADERGIPVDTARRARVQAATAGGWLAAAGAFATGFATGEIDDMAGLAGAVAGDLVGVGDVRDLSREGLKALSGEETDTLVVGLSVAGLAVTGATWTSLGAAAPARAGLTVLKTAARAGRLSAGLAADLARLARRAVDPALARRVASTTDGAALKALARGDGAAPLIAVGRDVARVHGRAGPKAVADALHHATNATDLAKAAVLSDRFGDGTRAVMKLLGRSALVLTRSLDLLLGWLAAALGWAYALAAASAATGRTLARLLPPIRRSARKSARERTGASGSGSLLFHSISP